MPTGIDDLKYKFIIKSNLREIMEYNEEQRIVLSEFFGNKGGGVFNQNAYNFVFLV